MLTMEVQVVGTLDSCTAAPTLKGPCAQGGSWESEASWIPTRGEDPNPRGSKFHYSTYIGPGELLQGRGVYQKATNGPYSLHFLSADVSQAAEYGSFQKWEATI